MSAASAQAVEAVLMAEAAGSATVTELAAVVKPFASAGSAASAMSVAVAETAMALESVVRRLLGLTAARIRARWRLVCSGAVAAVKSAMVTELAAVTETFAAAEPAMSAASAQAVEAVMAEAAGSATVTELAAVGEPLARRRSRRRRRQSH